MSGANTRPTNLGRISITNDTVVDNVSAHEGGGISLDDALFVDVTSTTVAKNLTTATAVTSDGSPAAAGLTTGAVSGPLQSAVDAAFKGTATVSNTLTGKVTGRYTTNDRLVSTPTATDGRPPPPGSASATRPCSTTSSTQPRRHLGVRRGHRPR